MKAVEFDSYGDVNVLSYRDVADPQPGAGEVLIRVKAAGVNPIDWKIRSGALAQIMPVRFPFILGWDVSGTVAAVGEGVTEFKVGDPVFGLLDTHRNGAYAELVVANAALLSSAPRGLDAIDAASLPMSCLTGVSLIELGLESQPGQKVLVTGALGAVGRSAIFALHKIGARPVAGVRASQRESAAALHAADIVALDDPEDLKRAGPFDAVADTIGGAVAAAVLPHVRPGGELATVVPPPPQVAPGSGVTAKPFWVRPSRSMLDRIGAAAASGELVIPIVQRLPLREARQAHTLGQNGVNGKILLVP